MGANESTHRMGGNVFGNPVTDSTLMGMPEFSDKKITRLDRARVANELKNAEEKDVRARQHVEYLKRQWGVGVSTLCLIYNATGDPINLVKFHNWYGHIGPDPYPSEIKNGQWGAFLHVKTSAQATGSVGAVVYRGKNDAGQAFDWLLAWENPWNKNLFTNNVYTLILNAGKDVEWGDIKAKMSGTGTMDSHQTCGCSSITQIGNYTSPTYVAELTLY